MKRCKKERDECRGTSKFPHAGQILAIHANAGVYDEMKNFTKIVTQYWFNELANATPEDIKKCCDSSRNIEYFMQIIRDEAKFVGCGVSKYVTEENGTKWNNVLMACNFSIKIMEDKPVYVTGPTASNCGKKGTHSKYTSLCNF